MEAVSPSIAGNLSVLMHVCKPGKPCEYGSYAVYGNVPYPPLPLDLLNEHTIVLYTIGVKLLRVYPSLLVFRVRQDCPPNPFGRVGLPDGFEQCQPGVCVDGRMVRLGDYKSYIYTSYSSYILERDGWYRGVLFSTRPIPIPGGNRWLKRRRLKKYMMSTTT